jgi:hypothetical protein
LTETGWACSSGFEGGKSRYLAFKYFIAGIRAVLAAFQCEVVPVSEVPASYRDVPLRASSRGQKEKRTRKKKKREQKIKNFSTTVFLLRNTTTSPLFL